MTIAVASAAGLRDAVLRERTRILHALDRDVHGLARRSVDAMRAEIPAYAAQDDRFFDDVIDHVARHYATNIATFLEDRMVTLDDIAFIRGAAMRRARAGFALEDFLNAFRVGQQVLWEAIVEEAGDTKTGHEAALSLVGPVMRYADFASTHAAHVYVEFEQYVVADADRERRDLLEHLLAGDAPPRGPLVAAAQRHGLTPDARMLVAAAVPVYPRADADVPYAASAAIARTGHGEAQPLVVVRQQEIVAVTVIAAGEEPAAVCDRLEELQDRLRREGMPLAMGVSTPADGIADLPRAYQEASSALECVADDGGVAALPRLSAFEYLAMRADDTARRLVDPGLRVFLDDDRGRGGVLTATIRAFARADLNLRAAADELQVHPNTAQYRMSRIEERTGRNPRHVADLVELLLAIALDDAVCDTRTTR